MVQFKILTGRRAGAVCPVEGFPARIGRSAGSEVALEDAGIWDEHLTLTLDAGSGYAVSLHQGAIATVNGQPFETHRLRNGDVIELGAAKIQFWIGPVRQANLQWRESALWIGLVILVVAQILLLWKLSP